MNPTLSLLLRRLPARYVRRFSTAAAAAPGTAVPAAPGPAVGSAAGPEGRSGDSRRRLTRLWQFTVVAPLLAMATGCATYMSAQVTTFHQAGSPEQRFAGQPFIIEATAAQQESLEFRAYADLVRQALRRHGLVDAPAGAPALAVSVRYSIDNGRPVVYGYPGYYYPYGYAAFWPYWGWGSYHGHGGHVHYELSAAFPIGYAYPSYTQWTVYRRELRVEITDRRPGGNGAKLFEGSVTSEGESGALAPVMPAMVDALFSDFPGPNGVTRLVSIPLNDPAQPAAHY